MTEQVSRRRLLTIACVLVGLLTVGVGPTAADVPHADDAANDVCDHYTTEAYATIDALEADAAADGVLSETDRIGPVQAVVAQLNVDLSRANCPSERSA